MHIYFVIVILENMSSCELWEYTCRFFKSHFCKSIVKCLGCYWRTGLSMYTYNKNEIVLKYLEKLSK